MSRLTRRTTSTLALVVIGLVLLWAASGADAASLAIKCSGEGPQNKAQEYETASCAVAPGEKRTVEGVLRNDKNKPVAGKLMVTFSTYIPAGGGAYDVTPQKHIEIQASASGKFKIPVSAPATTESALYIEALGDETKEVTPVAQEVEIMRYVTAVAKKLGGGKVRVTVKGIPGTVKIGITEEGYPATGGATRKAKNGVATFDLGSDHGTFGILVQGGAVTELYYIDSKPFTL